MTSGVAGRYATALFEIASEANGLDRLEGDIASLEAALEESPDLRHVIASPVFSRKEQGDAVMALASRMGLGSDFANTLGLMARNRRLFALPAMLAQLRRLISDARGEVAAEVTSAQPLSEAQRSALVETLKNKIGKDVALDMQVDESLIGGLVVRVGSQMIDTSIRSRLAGLQNVMKEVG